ncbi:MAG: hypothetical protein QM644_07730 [Mobilitalea sp.]
MLSADERYEEDIEQVQFLMKWTERKDYKKNKRKKKLDDLISTFRSSTKD